MIRSSIAISRRTLALVALSLFLQPHMAPAQSACSGDCNRDDAVTVDELVLGVNIALGNQPLAACSPMDSGGDGDVTVDELIIAVGAALNGCPAAPSPTPSAEPSASPSASPTEPPTASATATATATATETATTTQTATPTTPIDFCSLPGSVQSTEQGQVVIPGGPANTSDIRFMRLPVGFCAHFYAKVGNARQLRFAPGGELFVASPRTFTTGGGSGGQSAIVVLADDDGDGSAESRTNFLTNLSSTQGMMFANGFFYFQNATRIMRLPYSPGDRTAAAASQVVADINVYTDGLHWPKPLDIADDGTIYVGNGSSQQEACETDRPFRGGILTLDGSPNGALVAKGFRNPIAIRCSRGHNLCYAIELAKDYTAGQGGREKLLPIRQGGDWGFPCCATKDLPYSDVRPIPDCSTVVADQTSFLIGDTPFDLDFETNHWPPPWNNRVYVPLHGAYGTWAGARVVAIEIDPESGEVKAGHDLGGMSTGAMMDFATGWDDRTLLHGRPAAVAFAPDGRLFLANDNSGDIVWIAPIRTATAAN